MPSTILRHKEKIPSETRTILDALAEPTRQASVMVLAGKSEVSFRELTRSAQPMNPSTINHHLKALKAGLAKNLYGKTPGKRDYSFYALRGLGREFLRRIGRSRTTLLLPFRWIDEEHASVLALPDHICCPLGMALLQLRIQKPPPTPRHGLIGALSLLAILGLRSERMGITWPWL